MNRKPTVILFGVVFVVAAGLLGFNGIIANPFAQQDSSPSIKDATHSLGHVTAVIKDPDGNVKVYRQTDNIVVTTGKNCMADKTFGTSGGCATTSANFNYIAIGTGSNTQSTTDTKLVTEFTRLTAVGTQAIQLATSTVGAKVTESALFTLPSPQTIQEAGLFNTAVGTAGDMYAEEGFAAISANTNDQLTITWTVTTG